MLKTHQNPREKEKKIIEVMFYTTQSEAVVSVALMKVKEMLLENNAKKGYISICIGENHNPPDLEVALSTFGRVKVYEVVDQNQANDFIKRITEFLKSSEIVCLKQTSKITRKPLPQLLKPTRLNLKRKQQSPLFKRNI